MDGNIYSVLNVPENESKEELKAAFIAWKKPRQQLLRTGTREEQSQASAEISEMTKLYKEACEKLKSTNTGGNSNLDTDNENIQPEREESTNDNGNINSDDNSTAISAARFTKYVN